MGYKREEGAFCLLVTARKKSKVKKEGMKK